MKAARTCPDCGGEALRSLGELPDVAFFAGRPIERALPGGRLLHCQSCDLRFRWPTLPNYDRLYDNATVDAWSGDASRHDQRLVHERILRDPSASSVLDFGCYSGDLLAQLPSTLARFGVEMSGAAAAVARDKTGAEVVSSLEQFDPALRFDVIVAMDVIEHVRSPRELAAHLVQRLTPGGRLILTTGDGAALLWRIAGARWWYCYYPEHIAFISHRWLRHHAPAIGARISTLQRFNYLDEPRHGALNRWTRWIKYLARPGHYARKREAYLARHALDRGVPGMGLMRDHLLIELRREAAGAELPRRTLSSGTDVVRVGSE
jgi:SAM-dependent methyltransferase